MSTTENINGMMVQTADEGMVLTNGETYSKKVYLGEGALPWDEIPESEVPVIEEPKPEQTLPV